MTQPRERSLPITSKPMRPVRPAEQNVASTLSGELCSRAMWTHAWDNEAIGSLMMNSSRTAPPTCGTTDLNAHALCFSHTGHAPLSAARRFVRSTQNYGLGLGWAVPCRCSAGLGRVPLPKSKHSFHRQFGYKSFPLRYIFDLKTSVFRSPNLEFGILGGAFGHPGGSMLASPGAPGPPRGPQRWAKPKKTTSAEGVSKALCFLCFVDAPN